MKFKTNFTGSAFFVLTIHLKLSNSVLTPPLSIQAPCSFSDDKYQTRGS